MARVRIESWDGDLAFKMSDEIARQLDFKEGDKLDFIVKDGVALILRLSVPELAPDPE